MAERRPTTRRADALSNAARIVAAARRTFARVDGLASLEEVAREAGVGIATLYRHFASREALAIAVYEQVFTGELIPALDRAATDPSPLHGLHEAAERLVAVLSREQRLMASTGNFVALTDDLLQRFEGPLSAIVLRAQLAGELRTDLEVGDIPRLLVMFVAGLTVPGLPPGAPQRYLTLVFDGLRPERATALPPLAP